MDKKVREMLQTIQQNHICVHMGYSYFLMDKAYVREYGEYGVDITNINHLDNIGYNDTILDISLREITELEKMDFDTQSEYRGTSQDGDFIIEVLGKKVS